MTYSATVLQYHASSTPWLPGPKRPILRFSSAETDATPLALDQAEPALREAVIQFSGKLEQIRDEETVRVTCAGDLVSRALTSASFAGLVHVLKVGEVSRTDQEISDPLAVFNRIQEELAVTQKELLIAVGIKRRTYFAWRNSSAPHPRPSSLGKLWHLADALIDLRETLDRPLAAWLHASPERMAAMREGRFEELVDLAVMMPEHEQRAHGTSRRLGVAADVEVPIVKSDRAKVTMAKRGARR